MSPPLSIVLCDCLPLSLCLSLIPSHPILQNGDGPQCPRVHQAAEDPLAVRHPEEHRAIPRGVLQHGTQDAEHSHWHRWANPYYLVGLTWSVTGSVIDRGRCMSRLQSTMRAPLILLFSVLLCTVLHLLYCFDQGSLSCALQQPQADTSPWWPSRAGCPMCVPPPKSGRKATPTSTPWRNRRLQAKAGRASPSSQHHHRIIAYLISSRLIHEAPYIVI